MKKGSKLALLIGIVAAVAAVVAVVAVANMLLVGGGVVAVDVRGRVVAHARLLLSLRAVTPLKVYP